MKTLARHGLIALLLLPVGCDDDDEGSSGAGSSTSTSTSTSTTDGSTSSTSTSTTGTSTGPGTGDAGSTGPVSDCDPIIPGEWNACVGANGMPDNSLCNWMGLPDTQGFIGCLNSAGMDGANVCFIRDCVDACDCFAPPPTGTAEVICGPIVDGGANGCGLDCSGGRTCPEGMECQSDLCFWPAPA